MTASQCESLVINRHKTLILELLSESQGHAVMGDPDACEAGGMARPDGTLLALVEDFKRDLPVFTGLEYDFAGIAPGGAYDTRRLHILSFMAWSCPMTAHLTGYCMLQDSQFIVTAV